MVQITGFCSKEEGVTATALTIDKLNEMRHSGYDSCGVGSVDSKSVEFSIRRTTAGVKSLQLECVSRVCVGHLRWATHGKVDDTNAHPQVGARNQVAVVHNGVLENEQSLRAQLAAKGIVFQSETDTEVLVNLVEDLMESPTKLGFVQAVCQAVSAVRGPCGALFLSRDNPNILVGIARGSPLYVGESSEGHHVTSDPGSIDSSSSNISAVKDNCCVVIDNSDGQGEVRFLELDGITQVPQLGQLAAVENSDKGEFESFLLKEIFEQPEVLRRVMRGRVRRDLKRIHFGGLETVWKGKKVSEHMLAASRIIIVGCGSSFNSALVGKYLIEEVARIPVQVEYTGEFALRDGVKQSASQTAPPVVIVVTQSGESADTIAALRLARQQDLLCFGVCNGISSSVARETQAGIFLHAGPELAVTSTKAFSAQIAVLTLLALRLGFEKGTLEEAEMVKHMDGLSELPGIIEKVLVDYKEKMSEIGRTYRYATNFLYLGRGLNFPIAMEGAMKLKQLAYIHCEGYPAAEMKHGPIALIDKFMPVLFIAPRDHTYEKVVSNMREVHARQGSVICVTEEGNSEVENVCDFLIPLPRTEPWLVPLLTALPVQMLAYYIAKGRGENVDRPRNQSKVL